MLRTYWRWFHHCLQMVELLCAGRVYYCHRVSSKKKIATTLLFQSISYILLRLHNLYKYIEFLNASNYVFPTNHLVVWCYRDECGGGGDSREENIDRSFHPKSRLRITFFSFCFITFFFTWPKRQDYRFTRARHASFLLSQERKKKKTWRGHRSPLPDVVLLRFDECWETASVTWTQPNRRKKIEYYIYIYIHKDVCWSGGRVLTFRGGRGLSAKLSECSLKLVFIWLHALVIVLSEMRKT